MIPDGRDLCGMRLWSIDVSCFGCLFVRFATSWADISKAMSDGLNAGRYSLLSSEHSLSSAKSAAEITGAGEEAWAGSRGRRGAS